MTEKRRLLSLKEFLACVLSSRDSAKVEKAAIPWAFGDRLIRAQDRATLKAVGERLERGASAEGVWITFVELEALKRGEMP